MFFLFRGRRLISRGVVEYLLPSRELHRWGVDRGRRVSRRARDRRRWAVGGSWSRRSKPTRNWKSWSRRSAPRPLAYHAARPIRDPERAFPGPRPPGAVSRPLRGLRAPIAMGATLRSWSPNSPAGTRRDHRPRSGDLRGEHGRTVLGVMAAGFLAIPAPVSGRPRAARRTISRWRGRYGYRAPNRRSGGCRAPRVGPEIADRDGRRERRIRRVDSPDLRDLRGSAILEIAWTRILSVPFGGWFTRSRQSPRST